MEKMIQEFLDSMGPEGKSKCTIQSYFYDLNEFKNYMEKEGKNDVSLISYRDLSEWTNFLYNKRNSPTTISRKISSVKAFFSYLYKMDIIEKNPSEFLKKPKIQEKKPKVISDSDASDLLFKARNGDETIDSFRNYTIISVFLTTGIRREELTNIRVEDVDLNERTILIKGKGNKERTAYINEFLLPVISEYLYSHRSVYKYANESDFLFLSRSSLKISVRTINRIVNKAFEDAGIKENGVSAHVLRKRFATTVFRKTRNIEEVSEMLGHSSLAVTKRYVVINEESIRKSAECATF